IRGEGIIVLSPKREHGRVVVPRREVAVPVHLRQDRDQEQVASLAFFVRVPVPVKQVSENLSLDFGFVSLTELLSIAGNLIWLSVALRVNIRREENILSIRRPEFAASLSGHKSQLVNSRNRASRTIEIGNPDLRATLFCRQKSKPLPVRRPARTVRILICDDLPLLPARHRPDPHMGRLRIGLEIHIDHAEDHPLAVRRNLRLAHALQLHHVFEGKRMFGLRKTRKRECDKSEENKGATTHEGLPTNDKRQTDECSRPALLASSQACHPERSEGPMQLAASTQAIRFAQDGNRGA